ncbi:hypothetical protein HK413_08290 [Mucilaginibacter sp. S1162]|uniref:Uncharacterized protein n=1 Tax=Mucilaginibacter humi TaxID=2732510 RepID=A0ABX1W748_9SPHI|nr:hypothetical protein [Mucilaginibacter humi]NNU34147.1 hypothetical protein [Mucilaginibacter humi]
MTAEVFVLFLDKKNQKSSQQRGFLRSGPLRGSSGKTSGCKIFAPLRPLLPNASAKSCYAPNAQGRQFYLPSPKLFADGFITEPTIRLLINKCKEG